MSRESPKILVIGPKFFSYGSLIATRLSELGFNAVFVDERPGIGTIEKAVLRFLGPYFVPGLHSRLKKYLMEIASDSVEKILLLSSEVVTPGFFPNLRKFFPNAKIIAYSWDSIRNKPNTLKIVPFSDSAFSFDPEDATQIQGVKLRPLFYHPMFEMKFKHQNLRPKIGFLGTLHSDRTLVLSRILSEIKKTADAELKCFIYCQNKYVFAFRVLFAPQLWFSRKLISYESLPISNVIEWLKEVDFIIDIHHPKQTGLTMRTVEAIGMGKKLITTNKSIKNYAFYDPNMHFIVERKNPNLSFLVNQMNSVNSKADTLKEKVKLDTWISEVFNLQGNTQND